MGKRILVADDSLTIQKAFAMVLSGQDYTLVPARSVDEALAATKSGRPDLVIADAMLGNGSGYDLCASIKADLSLCGVPVHILVSSQNPLDEARARRAGADGHLIKPFDSQVLLDSLVAALSAPARVAPFPAGEVAPVAPVEQGNLTDEVRADEQDDDNYGEFTIERGSAAGPPSWTGRPPTWPGARQAPAASPPPVVSPASRPSLIPGVSPPPAASPARPSPPLPGVIPVPAAGIAARPAANRTIYGFPAPTQTPPVPPPVVARPAVTRPSGTYPIVAPRPAAPVVAPPVAVPPPPVAPPAPPVAAPVAPARAPVIPARVPTPVPPTAPVVQAPLRRSASMPVAAPPPTPGPLVAAVSSVIDQKVAAIAARGREYEAIAKLSREIIEQVVWEVVPELAEVIIRQEIDRLVASKR